MILMIASCGDVTDIQPTATFADRSDAEITRLVMAGLGYEGFAAQDAFDEDRVAACPSAVLAGDTVTATGDCTTASGAEIRGSIVVTNPISWPDYHWDNGSDCVYVYDHFTVIRGGHTISFDGVYRQLGGYAGHDMDLTVELDGVAVRSNVFIDTSQRYESFAGGVELVGGGGALINGSHDNAYVDDNHYQLAGTDTVEIDETPEGVLSWRLSNSSRTCTLVGSTDCQ